MEAMLKKKDQISAELEPPPSEISPVKEVVASNSEINTSSSASSASSDSPVSPSTSTSTTTGIQPDSAAVTAALNDFKSLWSFSVDTSVAQAINTDLLSVNRLSPFLTTPPIATDVSTKTSNTASTSNTNINNAKNPANSTSCQENNSDDAAAAALALAAVNSVVNSKPIGYERFGKQSNFGASELSSSDKSMPFSDILSDQISSLDLAETNQCNFFFLNGVSVSHMFFFQ